MERKITHIIGVDEAGETVLGTVARGCQHFCDARKQKSDNLNSSCKEGVLRNARQKIKYVVGVDEAGRGPLAGPVAVGIAVVPVGFDWGVIPGVNDSKKLTAENREAIFRRAKALKKEGILDFFVTLVSHTVIDRIGISKAVARGITKGLQKLTLDPRGVEVRLDGLLRAPEEYVYQRTIIKGDAKEKVIGLASICAKVTRDAYMVRVARHHPEYHFDIHKGYGTKVHLNTIGKYGLSSIHRHSFTKRFRDTPFK